MRIFFLLLFTLFSGMHLFAQRGKDGARTVSVANTIVNEYTTLTANATANSTSITVAASGLNANSRFSAGLAPGDLVMIIQMQGATMDAALLGIAATPNSSAYGAVTSYNNCGNNEILEVATVPNSTTITFTCGLKNDYTAAGRVQVVRIPRYTTLTLNSPGTITGQAWNGTTGGVVAIETQTSATINAGASIHANAIGFRGGTNTDNNSYFGAGFFGAPDNGEGAEKGEGIAGNWTDYDLVGGRYCMGAPANGGGGSTSHNAGGGGGANGGTVASWNGNGNPDVSTAGFINAWEQEAVGMSTSTSSGGGRGGYTFSNNNLNATTAAGAPGLATWGGDNRRVRGGLGGRPLDYSTGKIFMGGGGGSGDQNDGDAGAGGDGGGIVYLLSYGTISGAGSITANGENGANCNNAGPSITGYAGIDGAGGAGGGGCIILQSSGAISTIAATANGGTGGNSNFAAGALASPTYNPAYGPGGGGGGGYIAISNGAITRTTNGGNNGTTNSSGLTEFPANGATRGGAGTNNASITAYDITASGTTICSGTTATLAATVTGTAPGTVTWYSSQFGSTSVGTGTSFTTPTLTTTTTYYVGVCPGGSFRIPVIVTVNPSPTINTASMVIGNESCTGNDGSITGIVVTGATSMTWNGTSSASADITGLTAGNYTLVATSGSCSTTAGPFTVGSSGGPTINTAAMVITHTTCGNTNGSITGITATGSGTLTYTWNGNSSANANLSNVVGGNYTLAVTDGTGCTSSVGPFTINASSAPVLDITNLNVTDETCSLNNGAISGITMSGGTNPITITWNGNPSGSLNLTNLPGGNYTLVVTDAAGCSDTEGPIVVAAFAGPILDDASAIITNTTCGFNNGSITGIQISGGTAPLTFDYNGTTNPSADISNLASGSYTLTITDGNGCTVSSLPYTIASSTGISLTATGTNPSCFGTTDGSIAANTTGGSGTYTYTWNGTSSSSPFSGIGSGTYTVIATDGNACSDTSIVVLTDPAAINASISGTNLICSGQSTTLTASGASIFSWSTSESTASITVTPAATTNYFVVVSDGTCIDTATITVTVNAVPVAAISGDTVLCTGESTVLTGSGGTTYAWSTGGTSSSETIAPATSGTITLTATNNCGSDVISVNVIVNADPTADAGSDVTIALGAGTTLSPSGGTSYVWSPSGGLSCSACENPYASPTSTTTYTVTVTDANGCSASDDVTVIVDAVFVLFIPDAFSPNGDGNNDILFVRGAGIMEFEFKLYDRWGEMIFSTTELNTGWDGTNKGKALNTGVFVYAIEGKYLNGENFSQKGNITLHK
jgi:gliding motility-associated-like protein